MKIPKTPFSTRLSGSAKETELRIRSIFQWKKKRPPVAFVLLVAVLVLLCFGLFGFREAGRPEHQTLYDIHREFIDTIWKSPVAKITYFNTDHGFYEYTDGDDGIADVEDFFKSVQLGSLVNHRKYIKEDDKGYHIFHVYAGEGGRHKIKFFVDDRVVLVGSLEENEWPSNFADDAKAYRLPDGVDRDAILALLYSAGEDNEESSPPPEPPAQELPTITVSAEDLFNTMQRMGETDGYPAQTYQIEVTGLSVPVTLTVERNQATAVEAHGQFMTLSVPVILYGNREFDLFEADGAVIFGCSYYRIGDMYILSPEGCSEIHPGEEASYYLYRDDQGNLKYTLFHNEIATITQAGALTVVTRYGELLRAYGDASIVNGKVVFAQPGRQEFLDYEWLQQEFEAKNWSQHFSSVEEMLENNRAAKEGREPSQSEPQPEPTPEPTPEPSPEPTAPQSSDPGWVLLTFADGTWREGRSAPDDVEVEAAARGGSRLIFHVSEEELAWAASVEHQNATVRFGASEWEHPGELFYSSDRKALEFVPTSDDSRAYLYYKQLVSLFDQQSERFVNRQFVLDYVDAMFAEGQTDLFVFLFPGTGPIAANLDEYRYEVRRVFMNYEWTRETGSEPQREYSHDDWTMYLENDKNAHIENRTNSNWVRFTVPGQGSACYSHDGEPGSLSNALLEIFGGPAFRLARVYIPIEGQDAQTLMETYEEKFRDLYLASGAITDYRLRELSPITVPDGADGSPFFLFSFSVKPVNPSWGDWKKYTVDEDGWVDFSFEISLSQGGYENDAAWMCGFWQYPNDKE